MWKWFFFSSLVIISILNDNCQIIGKKLLDIVLFVATSLSVSAPKKKGKKSLKSDFEKDINNNTP